MELSSGAAVHLFVAGSTPAFGGVDTASTQASVGLMLMAAGLCLFVGCLWVRQQSG